MFSAPWSCKVLEERKVSMILEKEEVVSEEKEEKEKTVTTSSENSVIREETTTQVTPPATNNFYRAWRSPKKVLMQKSQKFCADFKYVNLKIGLWKIFEKNHIFSSHEFRNVS